MLCAVLVYLIQMLLTLSCRNYGRLIVRTLHPSYFPPASSGCDRGVGQISKFVNQVSEHDSLQQPHGTKSDVRYSHISPHIVHMLNKKRLPMATILQRYSLVPDILFASKTNLWKYTMKTPQSQTEIDHSHLQSTHHFLLPGAYSSICIKRPL